MPRPLNLTRADRLGYVVGGIALMVWALRKPTVARTGAAGLGGWLLYQAYTGRNPMFKPLGIRVNPQPADTEANETIVVEDAITISRPRAEVYAFLQTADNLPSLAGEAVQITRDVAPDELAWRATRGDRLMHFGSLALRDAPGGRGTIVAARLEYLPTGGSLGIALSHLMGRSPQRVLGDKLRRARSLLETGEIATTNGQSTGRR
ncbi:MAG TPA: hypothetical protein VM183_17750 [Burkholderiales bacterium]|nr:hypothetical protein [Burkholderiales bacterium]